MLIFLEEFRQNMTNHITVQTTQIRMQSDFLPRGMFPINSIVDEATTITIYVHNNENQRTP